MLSKILICDDSVLLRKKLKDNLKELGQFEIIEAEDGQQAVDLYKKHSPSLVFMDIVMPEKTGISALEEIKTYDTNAKIVVLSSIGTQTNLKAALKAGALDFIQKPWDEDQLSKVISRLIDVKEEI